MNAKRRTREEIKLQNRREILNAAKKTFLSQPYDEVSVRDIINDTSLASGTFYNYYRNKQEIFIAVIEREITPLLQTMDALRDDVQAFDDYLYRGLKIIFEFTSQSEVFRNMVLANESASRVIVDYCEATLTEDLGILKDRGILHYDDVKFLAVAYLGGVMAVARHLSLDNDLDAERAARKGTSLLLGQIN